MELILPLFVFVVLFVIGAMMLTLSWTPSSGTKHQKHPIQGTDFFPSQMYIAHDGCGGIAVDEHTLRICLLKTPAVTPQVLPISCLIGSFLIKNEEILRERLRSIPRELNRFQQLVPARLDELKQQNQTNSSHHYNQRIDLFVLIQDDIEPLHVINFLDMETKEGGILYENALATAAHWHKVLADLVFQADQQAQFHPEADKQLPDGVFPPAADLVEEFAKTKTKQNIPRQYGGMPEEISSTAKS